MAYGKHKSKKSLKGSTKLTRMSDDELSALKSDKAALDKLIRQSIDVSYRRLDKIKSSWIGRNEPMSSEYNKMFTTTMGATKKKAIDRYETKLSGLSEKEQLAEMHSVAAYLKRHLSSELSSVKGIEELKKSQLKGITEALGTKGEIDRVDTRGKHGYRIGGTFYSDAKLTKFWDTFHKSMEESHATKGDSNTLLQEIIAENKLQKVSMDDMLTTISSYYDAKREQEEERKRRLSSQFTSRGLVFYND